MVELQVPRAIAAKYATLTATRSLLCAHQSPFREMEKQMFQKLPLAQHGLLGTPGSGAPTSAVASHPPAFCWKTWSFWVRRARASATPSPYHSSILPELWKSAGTISWASYRRCYTAFVKVKMLKICQMESFAPTSFRNVGQGATRVEDWLNITF